MGGNISSSKTKKGQRVREDVSWDDSLKAYKVYPSDQDRAGRVVADVGIDRKASAYINSTTNKWNHPDFAAD